MPEQNRPARIYVRGPMTGYPDLNFPAFAAETARLRRLGYEVINPAELNPDGASSCEVRLIGNSVCPDETEALVHANPQTSPSFISA